MVAPAKTCPHCAELEPAFDRGKALFISRGVGRSILHELKYRNRRYVLDDLSRMVSESKHYLEYIQNTTLVPVPLHPVKFRERGFNQSELIAKMLVQCTGNNAHIEKLIIRRQYTQSQTQLNRSQRYQNVKNAFALARNAVLDSEKTFTIVDDIFTTGSTLNACAKVLRKAGAIHLQIATIGHG